MAVLLDSTHTDANQLFANSYSPPPVIAAAQLSNSGRQADLLNTSFPSSTGAAHMIREQPIAFGYSLARLASTRPELMITNSLLLSFETIPGGVHTPTWCALLFKESGNSPQLMAEIGALNQDGKYQALLTNSYLATRIERSNQDGNIASAVFEFPNLFFPSGKYFVRFTSTNDAPLVVLGTENNASLGTAAYMLRDDVPVAVTGFNPAYDFSYGTLTPSSTLPRIEFSPMIGDQQSVSYSLRVPPAFKDFELQMRPDNAATTPWTSYTNGTPGVKYSGYGNYEVQLDSAPQYYFRLFQSGEIKVIDVPR